MGTTQPQPFAVCLGFPISTRNLMTPVLESKGCFSHVCSMETPPSLIPAHCEGAITFGFFWGEI